MSSLNREQRAAVERWGQDVCVVAGPGTGKTRVLVERFRWLVQSRNVEPDRILAITFTNEAANQMKQRLAEAFEHDPVRLRQIERAWVSTIHGFCARLLREHAIEAGLAWDFSVLTPERAWAWTLRAAEEALETNYRRQPECFLKRLGSLHADVLESVYRRNLVQSLVDLYERLRIAGLRPSDLPSAARPQSNQLLEFLEAFSEYVRSLESEARSSLPLEDLRRQLDHLHELLDRPPAPADIYALSKLTKTLGKQRGKDARASALAEYASQLSKELIVAVRGELRELIVELLEELDQRYRSRKQQASALDFTDLEERALELLRDEALCQRVQQRFDFVLMDELQDTNPLQWQIVGRVRRPDSFFAVGDMNQSIYGFRHATPELFRRYRDELATQGHAVDQLSTNYRSVRPILQLANLLASKLAGLEPNEVWPADHRVDPYEPVIDVAIARGKNVAEAARAEADWIARRIKELASQENRRWGEFAVLARKRATLEPIQQALRRRGIPCLIQGGQTLMETREVRDLLLALRVLANPLDDIALVGVLRSPLVQVSDPTLFWLGERAEGDHLWALLRRLAREHVPEIPKAELEQLLWFVDLVHELRQNRRWITPDRLLARWVDASGYLITLDDQARTNVERFFQLLHDITGGRPFALRRLIEELDFVREAGAVAEPPPAEAGDQVQLMTVHAAKGLEFPVVFITGLNREIRDERPVVRFDPHLGWGARWRLRPSGECLEDPFYEAIQQKATQEVLEEEARLLYVAITRAKERLLLSWGQTRKQGSRTWKQLLLSCWPVNSELPGYQMVENIRVHVSLVNDLVPEGESVDLVGPEAPNVFFPKASPEAQYDFSLAVTALAEFVLCPRRYYLEHYLGLEPPPNRASPATRGGGTRARDLGTIVHELLSGKPIPEAPEEARTLVERFHASPLATRIDAADEAHHEEDFAFELCDVVLEGKIDVWFREGDRLVVLDYKTDQKLPQEGSPRWQAYEVQLQTYALALEQLTGRPASEAYAVFVRHGEYRKVELGDWLADRVSEQLERWKNAQQNCHFPLRESEECWACPYRGNLCRRD